MMRRFMFVTAAVLAGSAMFANAAPKDEVTDAAKKLADAKSYSWKATTERQGGAQGGGQGQGRGGFGGGPVEGKTEKDGFTHVAMTVGENKVEAITKGDKGAVKTRDGWQSFAELSAQQASDNQGQGQGRGRGMTGRMLQNTPKPAAQAQELAAAAKELTKADDAFTGELTEKGVIDLLSFRSGGRRGQSGQANDGNAPPPPTNAKGTVKFWVKDGVLSKYEYHVEGTREFNGNEVKLDRTTTVEIKDIDSAKVEVPEEAKGKVS